MESSIEMNGMPGKWSEIEEQKDRLRNETISMITTLNRVLKKNRQLSLTREYVTQKKIEYGDFAGIGDIFSPLSAEYKGAMGEFENLQKKYRKAKSDARNLPKVNDDISKDIAALKEAIFLAVSETNQMLKAFPGLEALAKTSERITAEHYAVREDLGEKSRALNDLEQKYARAGKEKAILLRDVSEKKDELASLQKTEASHREKLSDITRRAELQQTLTEEKQGLKRVMETLEKGLLEKREKIKGHEIRAERWNKEIGGLKEESATIRAALTEYQALVDPFVSLKTGLEKVEGEISDIDAQVEKLKTETAEMKKDEEILRIKAKQFEQIKKRMAGRNK